ncbi:PREDICTED: uncharacterized protein LOC105456648, partial [Wasmannia auropunctata]|uniref:uncharacterized protein LOC105456648 n=1 Tax=Wasmannia auropunctata TaxID=64793 RepID=UPI0005EFE0D8
MFRYQRIPGYIITKMPPGYSYGRSDNGWMKGENFFEYIANVFYPWLIKNEIQFPVVLFVDGHSSHLTQPLSAFCATSGIELVALHPNSTHIIQPMDVSLFKSLKTAWKQTISNYQIKFNQLSIQYQDFGTELKETLEGIGVTKILKNGFRVCGLHPFNIDAIDFSKLFKRENTLSKPAIDHEDHNKFLAYMENMLGSEIMTFKENKDDEWKGLPENRNLFNFWNKVSKLCVTNSNTISNITQDDLTFVDADLNENVGTEARSIKYAIEIPSNINIENNFLNTEQSLLDCDDVNIIIDEHGNILDENYLQNQINETLITQDNENEDPLIINKQSKVTETVETNNKHLEDVTNIVQNKTKENFDLTLEMQVPTAFKKSVFWSKLDLSKDKKRKPRSKIPSVLTSEQGLQYLYEAEENKKKKEEAQEQRKNIGLERLAAAKEIKHCSKWTLNGEVAFGTRALKWGGGYL